MERGNEGRDDEGEAGGEKHECRTEVKDRQGR